ncbi:Vacuolar fusion protein mon1 [Rhodotorula kratochvilovae]
MEGTEPFFHSLTATLQTSLPILLSSIEVYRVSPSVRAELSLALDPGKEAVRSLDLLYVLLLCNGRLVTLLRPKKHSIHPTDLHLLLSTIYAPRASPSGARPSPLTQPGAETWLPVCLPRFNPRGFLHAYVAFPSGAAAAAAASGDGSGSGSGSGVGLVLLSSQRDALPGVRAAASSILARLAAGDALHALSMARAQQAYSLGEVAVPGVRHFVYKDRGLVQVTRAGWEGEYAEDGGEEGERARMRLLTLYQHLHDALHPRPAAAGTAYRPPAQVQYLRTEHEAVLGWVTPQFELYLATSPLLPHSAVVSAARAVSRWVKKEERGLFLHGAGTF